MITETQQALQTDLTLLNGLVSTLQEQLSAQVLLVEQILQTQETLENNDTTTDEHTCFKEYVL